jgi:hypothetical protein
MKQQHAAHHPQHAAQQRRPLDHAQEQGDMGDGQQRDHGIRPGLGRKENLQRIDRDEPRRQDPQPRLASPPRADDIQGHS